ncbi:MAG TPA: radical SAM protein, partial [Candidatus Omnitrophota bacterium]|nr:radical SAM protein [Candidatus Omnitrophota bacterium]
FRGYIHLKVIPGASDAAIRQCVSLASAVSLNIETAGADNFRRLSKNKDYQKDILNPISFISRLTSKGSCFERVKHTTQFVVGASCEKDSEIIGYSWKLYKELGLDRIYFSAYQRGAGSKDLPGEDQAKSNEEILKREHRLYQTDWLLRKYGFKANEIPLDSNGNLSLEIDPKEAWAKLHPEFFPVNVNKDDKYRLIRVPGLGQLMVERILAFRNQGLKITSLNKLAKMGKLLKKAEGYIVY